MDMNKRLRISKSIHSPVRKCSSCDKTIFFRSYRCRHCRSRCHKKCVDVSKDSLRRNPHKCSTADEEHWTKVLQANEVNSNMVMDARQLLRHIHQCRHAQQTSTSQIHDAKDSNVITHMYSRFCNWVAKRRTSSSSTRSSTSRKSRLNSNKSEDVLSVSLSEDIFSQRGHLRSSASAASSRTRPSQSSTSSTESAYSDISYTSEDNVFLTRNNSDNFDSHYPNIVHQSTPNKTFHPNLTFTISCPPKSKVKVESEAERKLQLCQTWPLTGRKLSREDCEDDEEQDLDESVFGDCEYEQGYQHDDSDIRESLGECSIQYSDLKIGECVRVGRTAKIYHGNWHGDVMIQCYTETNEEDARDFWNEVSKLSMIRHENVTLFMGASIELPNLAVVTSVLKGPSLYETTHVKQDIIPLHTKVHILRQIAQAMGYLHAKGIVLKKLNSKNVYLESKVKVSVMDYGMAEKVKDKAGYGCLPKGHITYIAPEVLRTAYVDSPRLITHHQFTHSSDVYAFGTVAYELLSNRFPYESVPIESVIWQVGTGRQQTLDHLKCPPSLKNLVEECWSHDIHNRPDFTHINKELQQNSTLHKRHSSSEPERLNKLALSRAHSLFP